MQSLWMTPTPSEAARDETNAINRIVLQMQKHLPDYGYELVENPDNANLYAAHAGQGSTRPIDVAHYHGLYPTAQGSENFAVNARVINNLRTAKRITAPSQWIADVIRRDMHINPDIIPWGVDTQEWQPSKDKHVYAIWNKARVDNVSDPAPMLELAAKAHNTLFLTTFGEGTPNVKTIGRQPYETMKEYVRNAAVYLSLNVETFGLGILEACAAGVPILGFRQGAIAEYLTHGINAFLAEPGDMQGLYEGLQYCLKYRDQLGANARELAKQFTWRAVARGFARVYEQALIPHKGAKVSIVIPCHNYAQYLPIAIESALKQVTRFPYEIIVVLDRCTDNSAEIAHSYADKGVITLTVDNGNLSATRNAGIEHGTGEYIVCLDADDEIGSEHFLQTLADALDADAVLGIAFTSIQVMNSEGELGHINPWPNGYNFDLQAQRRNQVPSCCMFRKEAWRRAGGFRPFFVYAQDAEFWTTVGSLGYTAKHVVYDGWFRYRIHNQSQSMAHRTGEVPEPDWTEFHPWTRDGQRPFAADGKGARGSWPVRFYDKPEVSIIIPVGNGHEDIVKDALHSVEGQTFRLWECIVVNDSDTELVLEGFPWAKIVETDTPYSGAGAARNAGLKQAKGQFVAFLDADDMLKPSFLELALAAYRRHGKYIYGDWLTHDKQTRWERHDSKDYSLEAYRESMSIHPITALIPKSWVEAVGGFDENMDALEDVDFYLKLLKNGFCGKRIPEPVLIYNLDSGQRRKVGEARQREYRAIMKERYGAFMEQTEMCNCVEPPKGKTPMPPTPENVADYRETYGEMIKIQFTWMYAPEGQTVFKGPATKVNYQRRAKNDVFYIWQKDYEGHEEMFTLINDYETEPPQTVIPPEPELVAYEDLPTEPIENVMSLLKSEVEISSELEPEIEHMAVKTRALPRKKPGRKSKVK